MRKQLGYDVDNPFTHLQPAVAKQDVEDDASISSDSECSIAAPSVCPCGDVHERVTECDVYHNSSEKWTDLFTVDQVWIFDSGCPDDLVAERKVHEIKDRLEIVPKKTFCTANGKIKATKGLSFA